MAVDLAGKLRVGISSRALFELGESHSLFEKRGVEEYSNYQIAHENEPLGEGVAFGLVKKLLALRNQHEEASVEVILLSRNSADTGLRIFNAIEQHGLNITRAVFSRGETPWKYAEALGVHLFLSADAGDVRLALQAGIAAATILPSTVGDNPSSQLRIAFDGDAVVFSDEAELIYKTRGLEAFIEHERSKANTPLASGPFRPFLEALHRIQRDSNPQDSPIRTALVTARNAPTHKRVIHTLRAWGVRIDEAVFLGGVEKGPVLKAFGADIFFDDQTTHCDSARQHVATGHVPITSVQRA
ncbi:MAG: 5'-nucleotidase [Ferrovum sp.]|uniref:5'-nucleotidase n=1 Tax=Ferrovum sp. TaxID=2609467 RepID=UPI00344C9102|nr:5'-nucleotidase [Ferrovum sp.]